MHWRSFLLVEERGALGAQLALELFEPLLEERCGLWCAVGRKAAEIRKRVARDLGCHIQCLGLLCACCRCGRGSVAICSSTSASGSMLIPSVAVVAPACDGGGFTLKIALGLVLRMHPSSFHSCAPEDEGQRRWTVAEKPGGKGWTPVMKTTTCLMVCASSSVNTQCVSSTCCGAPSGSRPGSTTENMASNDASR